MTATTPARLACTAIDAGYGGQPVVRGVDLTVEAGEIVALVGGNGAGKSTLLRAISRLVPLSGGRVEVDGHDITHGDPRQAIGRGVVHVPGGRGVFASLSVADHFTTASHLCPPAAHNERVDRALDRFPVLRARWAAQAGDLSGGEQQQLNLAMALMADPRVLLVDELSLGLAPAVVSELIELLRGIGADGCSVVVVDQSISVVCELATRAYVLEKGEVRYEGPTRGAAFRRELPGAVLLSQPSRSSPAPRRSPRRDRAATGAVAALSVEGLQKRYGGVVAVNRVSFEVGNGAIVGLVGPNGSGKTTALDCITGLTPPSAGTIRLGGVDVTRTRAPARARAGLGRLFQDGRCFPTLTVAENLALAFERMLPMHDPLASILGLRAARRMERTLAGEVDALMSRMGLTGVGDHLPAELSTGTRRILGLAMVVAHSPSVVLLDEPTAGLAPAEADELVALLTDLRAELGCAMVIVEHDLAWLGRLADEMVVLAEGTVIGRGVPGEVFADERVQLAYGITPSAAIGGLS